MPNGHEFDIYQQVSGASNNQYLIIETYPTSEGRRTRVCGERFKTLGDAEAIAAAWKANT